MGAMECEMMTLFEIFGKAMENMSQDRRMETRTGRGEELIQPAVD